MTAPDFAHTDWAIEARTQKAVRLEGFLRIGGWTATQVEAMDPSTRRGIERAAGVRRSSDETWALVARLMRSGQTAPP